MCCGNENNADRSCCLSELIREIVNLQNMDADICCSEGCDKPFLGPTLSCECYNTRPLSFYNCQSSELWNIQYTINETTATSTVFRAEKVDNCCCTCRILIDNGDDTYTATRQFFTIDLKCVSALQCHPDVFVDLC